MKKFTLSRQKVFNALNHSRSLRKEGIHHRFDALRIEFDGSERCSEIELAQFFHVLRKFRKLKTIKIDLNLYCGDLHASTLTNHFLKLKNVSEVVLKMECEFQNNESFHSFAKNLRNLNSKTKLLSIHTFLRSANHNSMQTIWKNLQRFPLLRSLDLRMNLLPPQADESFKKMPAAIRSLPQLSSFTFEATTSQELNVTQYTGTAFQYLPKLKNIDFSLPNNLATPCFQITKLYRGLMKLPNLESLAIKLCQQKLSLPEFKHSFCGGLQTLIQLKFLKLCAGFSKWLNTEGFQTLFYSIQQLGSLVFLDLALFKVEPLKSEDLEQIISTLTYLPHLKILHLRLVEDLKPSQTKQILKPLDYSRLINFVQEMESLKESSLNLPGRGIIIIKTKKPCSV